MKHFDDEDGLVYETTRVTARKVYILANRLMTTADFKPKMVSTPFHIADVSS